MQPNLLKILTFFILAFTLNTQAQEIWRESFSIPGKGIRGSNDTPDIKIDFNIRSVVTSPDSFSRNGKTLTPDFLRLCVQGKSKNEKC